jgi:hypothetical protein
MTNLEAKATSLPTKVPYTSPKLIHQDWARSLKQLGRSCRCTGQSNWAGLASRGPGAVEPAGVEVDLKLGRPGVALAGRSWVGLMSKGISG